MTDALPFKTATAADAAAVRDLTRAAYARWVPLIGREPRPMGADYETAVREHRIDLFERDGGLAGLIEMAAKDDHLLIVNVAVAPERQGGRLGEALMAHAERVAAALGYSQTRLYTNKLMAANVRLYLRLGYRVDREEPIADGFAIHMSKPLSPGGAGSKLLFLPGAGASADFWRPVAQGMHPDRARRFFSWPGLGDEPPDPAVRGLEDLVGMVVAEMTEPCDLVAQSMGGLVAIKAALAAPGQVRRLVLTATSGGVPVRDLGGAAWNDNYRRNYPNAAPWITEAREDLSGRLHEIHAPTLLLWGGQDPISPLPVGERLCALMPNATLRVIAGGAHDLAQTHAAEIAPLIASHLR